MSLPPTAGIMPRLRTAAKNLNSGTHACSAITLPMKSYPQTLSQYFFLKNGLRVMGSQSWGSQECCQGSHMLTNHCRATWEVSRTLWENPPQSKQVSSHSQKHSNKQHGEIHLYFQNSSRVSQWSTDEIWPGISQELFHLWGRNYGQGNKHVAYRLHVKCKFAITRLYLVQWKEGLYFICNMGWSAASFSPLLLCLVQMEAGTAWD